MTAQKPKQHQKPKKKPKNVKKAEKELAAKYTYRITWSEEDGEYVGLCAEFPSLSWLAPTRDKALHGIERMVGDVLRDMAKADEPIPEPIAARRYSGKFVVRVPPEVHRRLALEAAEQNVSLNRLASAKLAGE